MLAIALPMLLDARCYLGLALLQLTRFLVVLVLRNPPRFCFPDGASVATKPLLLRGAGSFTLPPTGSCSFGKSRTLDAILCNAAVASASC